MRRQKSEIIDLDNSAMNELYTFDHELELGGGHCGITMAC